MLRDVAVVSVARSDYSILRPVLRAIEADAGLRLTLIATGMHLSPEFGATATEIERDGFKIAERIEMLVSSDTPEGIGKSIGLGVIGFSQLFGRYRPDLLMIMGDRFEMLAAALAALPFRIPLAHIHGGETSEGAIDEAMRHAITKMAYLHFVSADAHRRRVIQLGEDPDRVIVSGAPALDNLASMRTLSPAELCQRFGLDLAEPPLVVTFHPTTLEYDRTEADTRALLDALARAALPVVFTAPNADTQGRRITEMIAEFVERSPHAWLVPNFGVEGYYSLLKVARAMVGNSSSGIIEAASFGLPVVNVGNRQRGRLSGENVLHAPADTDAIVGAIATAVSDDFRRRAQHHRNPYGDGTAAGRIVAALKTMPLEGTRLLKRFHDLPMDVLQ